MIVRSLKDIAGTSQDIHSDDWSSARLLIKKDNLGYSLHITHVQEGSELKLHYTNHIESNYCFAGVGEVEDITAGKTYPIQPGTVYVLDQHDEHILRALKGDLQLVCIFTPALTGDERHNSNGSYELK